jgi:hypothetical protein
LIWRNIPDLRALCKALQHCAALFNHLVGHQDDLSGQSDGILFWGGSFINRQGPFIERTYPEIPCVGIGCPKLDAPESKGPMTAYDVSLRQ